MARQREVVYAQRRNVLLGTDEAVREGARNMVEDTVGGVAELHLNPQVHPEDWDLDALKSALVDYVPSLETFDYGSLRKMQAAEAVEALIAAALERYDHREAELSPPLMRAVERFVILQVVDNAWKEHLHNLDVLRQGIGLRGYGQRDPFQEYKIEATRLFDDMVASIKAEATKFLFRLKVEVEPTPMAVPVPAAPVQESEPQASDPFTLRRESKPTAAPSGMSRAERRRLEREEKKKNKK